MEACSLKKKKINMQNIYISQKTKKKRKRKRKKKNYIQVEKQTIVNKQVGNNKLNIKDNKNRKNQSTPKKLNIIISLFLILIVIVILVVVIIWNNIKLTLVGNDTIDLDVHYDYIESGYIANIYNHNLDNNVLITSNLNIHKLGKYEIIYKIYGHKKVRYINIIDQIPPEIILNGEKEITLYQNDKYIDPGVNIIDNYDANLNDRVIINNNVNTEKLGTYTVTYKVSDSSRNTSTLTRKVKVVKNPIDKYIENNNYSVSVGYYNLITGKSYYYNRNKKYYGASLIKVLTALYLYDNNKVTNSLKPYINSSLTYSNNDTHIYLVNYIGRAKLRKYGLSIGAKYPLEEGYDYYANTTVDDQIVYYKKLYELIKDEKNKELKNWMINSSCNYIMFNNQAPDALTKYGRYKINFHNAGLVLDDEPYIVVILTHEGNNDYYNIIRNIAKKVYEYHEKD